MNLWDAGGERSLWNDRTSSCWLSLLVVASLHVRGIRSPACELQDCIDCVVISASGAPFLALHVLPLTTKLGVFPLSFPIHGFPFSEVGNLGTAPINPGEISSLHYRLLGGRYTPFGE